MNEKYKQAEPVARPDDDKVICPACTHQFRAIPVSVQKLMLDAGFEPPYTHPAPAVAQEPVGFRYKTRSIKYPENGWSGWHFQEGVPANYHLTDDGNFEFLTRLLYDHSTPDVAPTEVLRELVEALNDFSNYVHAEQSSTDGHVQYSNTQIIRLAFKARSALKSAKEHGL